MSVGLLLALAGLALVDSTRVLGIAGFLLARDAAARLDLFG